MIINQTETWLSESVGLNHQQTQLNQLNMFFKITKHLTKLTKHVGQLTNQPTNTINKEAGMN